MPTKNASPRATAGKNHECDALRLAAFSVFRRLSAKSQALFCATMKDISYSLQGGARPTIDTHAPFVSFRLSRKNTVVPVALLMKPTQVNWSNVLWPF